MTSSHSQSRIRAVARIAAATAGTTAGISDIRATGGIVSP